MRSKAIVDNFLYLANLNTGLTIIDIQTPSEPRILSHVEHTGCRSLFADGNLLYSGTYDRGIDVYDISDRTSPRRIHGFLGSEEIGSIRVQNGVLIGSLPEHGLVAVDVREPENPIEFARHDTHRCSHGVVIHDRTVYTVCKYLTILELQRQGQDPR